MQWERDAYYIIQQAIRKQRRQLTAPGEKVVICIWVYWPDARRRDMSNMHKLLPDIMQGMVFPDDLCTLLRDMDYAIDRKDPHVDVLIYKLADEMHEDGCAAQEVKANGPKD